MKADEYDRLKTLVERQLRAMGIPQHLYDDYVQEAYLYIINRKGKFDLEDPYIYGDIKNGIINYYNKEKKHSFGLEFLPEIYNGSDNVYYMDLLLLILKEEYGHLLILNKFHGYTYEELSNYYNISKSKVYSEINKIINKITWVYSCRGEDDE